MDKLDPGSYVVCDPSSVTTRVRFPFSVKLPNGTFFDQKNVEYVITSGKLAVIPWKYTTDPSEFDGSIKHALGEGINQIYSPTDQWIWGWKENLTIFHSMIPFYCSEGKNLIQIGPIQILR